MVDNLEEIEHSMRTLATLLLAIVKGLYGGTMALQQLAGRSENDDVFFPGDI